MTKNIKLLGAVAGALLAVYGVVQVVQRSNDSGKDLTYRVENTEKDIAQVKSETAELRRQMAESNKARHDDHIRIVEMSSDIKYIKESVTEMKRRKHSAE